MLEWLFFNVALPLLPVPMVRLLAWLAGRERGFVAILSDGQLRFYATTLTAAATHDLAKRAGAAGDARGSTLATLGFGGCMFVFISSAMIYGAAVAMADTSDHLYRRRLARASSIVALFATTLVLLLRWRLGMLQ